MIDATLVLPSAAISDNACQNGSSRDTLVRWPATVIERLVTGRRASVLARAVMAVEVAFGAFLLGRLGLPLRLGPAEGMAVLGRYALLVGASLRLAGAAEVDDVRGHGMAPFYFGPIISWGRTNFSKSSAVT